MEASSGDQLDTYEFQYEIYLQGTSQLHMNSSMNSNVSKKHRIWLHNFYHKCQHLPFLCRFAYNCFFIIIKIAMQPRIISHSRCRMEIWSIACILKYISRRYFVNASLVTAFLYYSFAQQNCSTQTLLRIIQTSKAGAEMQRKRQSSISQKRDLNILLLNENLV